MGKVAYTIKGAAKAASVEKAAVVLAIQDGALSGRLVHGGIVILKTDLHAWLEAQPDYLRAMG